MFISTPACFHVIMSFSYITSCVVLALFHVLENPVKHAHVCGNCQLFLVSEEFFYCVIQLHKMCCKIKESRHTFFIESEINII